MTLNSISFGPVSGGRPRQLVVLLHGISDTGNGMLRLAKILSKTLPDAQFVMPHGPQVHDMGPHGRQWFSTKDWRTVGVSAIPAMVKDMEASAKIVNDFIDERLRRANLDDSNLVLVGFSQGASMSLFAGPRRANRIAGILALSGRFLSDAFNNIASLRKPPVHAIHGVDDAVIPLSSHVELVDALRKAGFEVSELVLDDLDHSFGDPRQIESGAAFLKKVLLKPVNAPGSRPVPRP